LHSSPLSLPVETYGAWLEKGLEPLCLASAGELFCTSGVPGIDVASGLVPERPEDQFELAFANLISLLASNEVPLEAVGLLTVFIPSRQQRPYIDRPWLDLFPDSLRRPARKTTEVRLPDGLLVQLQAIGVRGEQCRSVEIPGLRHRAPVPMGALIGSNVFSSVIGGDDPATGELVLGPAAQISEAFRNASRLMREAGGGTDGINHIWAFMGDMSEAHLMLEAYLQSFPRPANRPARKTVPYKLPENLSVQLQISGDIGGRIANFEVQGVGHHDPIPLASLAGRLLQSSGIHGIDPATSRLVEGGIHEQARISLDTIESLMREAGGTLSSIAGLTVLVRETAEIPWLTATIEQRFSGHSYPALRFVAFPLPDELDVQFHVTGWI